MNSRISFWRGQVVRVGVMAASIGGKSSVSQDGVHRRESLTASRRVPTLPLRSSCSARRPPRCPTPLAIERHRARQRARASSSTAIRRCPWSRSTSGTTSARRTSGRGTHRLRAPVRAHALPGQRARRHQRALPPRPEVGGVANGSTWYDRTNYYETLPSRQPRARALARVGPHGLPAAGIDPGEARDASARW